MENHYLGVELKPYYFNEFIACGIPIPSYTNDSHFVLKFDDIDSYLNYINVLKMILNELDLADPDDNKYDLHRSKDFIKNILFILRNQLSEKKCG